MTLNVELENQFGINYYLTLVIFCVVLFHKEKIKMENGKSMLELSSREFYSIISNKIIQILQFIYLISNI